MFRGVIQRVNKIYNMFYSIQHLKLIFQKNILQTANLNLVIYSEFFFFFKFYIVKLKIVLSGF